MTSVLVTHSDSHPIALDTVQEHFEGDDVRDLKVPPGGLQQRVDDELERAIEGCEVLLLRPGLVTASVIKAAEDLQVIGLIGSGYDHVDVRAATDNGVIVLHSPENPGPSVVEHTFGLALSLLRDLPARFERTSDGRWSESRHPSRDLRSSTLGVVGLGVIGFGVADVASSAFGADVVGYDPYVTGEVKSAIYPRYDRSTVTDAGIELVDKQAVFERADLVTVHVPLTDDTHEFVGAPEFEALEGGYFVNTCRGRVVDEDALVDAVQRGTLCGVALDVYQQEPPDPDHPLLGSDRVYTTPHVAGRPHSLEERGVELLAGKVETVLDGGRPEYVVNPEVFE